MSKTFKERYLSHEIELEAIDDYIIEWNNSDTEETLAKFLGLNKEEETAWVEDSDDALFDLLEAQRKYKYAEKRNARYCRENKR